MGTPQDDTLTGTPEDDFIFGLGGNDTIFGRGGADFLSGGSGNDFIDVSGDQEAGFQDQVICGAGEEDVVLADENDEVDEATCELINPT